MVGYTPFNHRLKNRLPKMFRRYFSPFALSVWILAAFVFSVDQFLMCSDEVEVKDLVPPQHSPSSTPVYNRSLPVTFVVGIPHSGASLLRAMLDTLEQVECSPEVYVLSQMLGMQMRWQHAGRESIMLVEGGISRDVLAAAVSAFSLEVMSRGGPQPDHLCTKLAYALSWSDYILEMFPRVRFLLVVRDGRAFAHSVITEKLRITGFMARNVTQALRQWNRVVRLLDMDCRRLGPQRCLYVQYERLVLDSETTMRSILDFLELPWDDRVLHPERNGASGPSNSGPIRSDSATAWYRNESAVPECHKYNASSLAPMLTRLGYDDTHFPPRYVIR